MEVAEEKTFGPLAAIFTSETEEEVIKLANSTEFCLASYLFSADVGWVIRAPLALESGIVGANTGKTNASETIFGSIKKSASDYSPYSICRGNGMAFFSSLSRQDRDLIVSLSLAGAVPHGDRILCHYLVFFGNFLRKFALTQR